jgi:hypothetical protein
MFEDRERAEEALFAHNREMSFQAQARRNKLFGLWAASQRGLAGDDAQRYAASLVLEDFPHYRAAAVLHRVASDFAEAGVMPPEQEIATALAASADRAQCEVMAGMSQRRP